MRSIQGKNGSTGIIAILVIVSLIGCKPAGSDKQLGVAIVPTNTTTTPAETADLTDTSTQGDEAKNGNAAQGQKIAVETKSLEEILKEVTAEKGKWTVVDVWSTSCIPCLKEFPHLVTLSKKYPDKVRCFSINVDYIGLKSKPPETYVSSVEEFLTKQKAEFKNFLSSTPDSDVFGELEIESIPAVMIFGPEGDKKKTFTDDNSGEDGVTYEGDIIPWLENALK